jgi:hypothetical protein
VWGDEAKRIYSFKLLDWLEIIVEADENIDFARRLLCTQRFADCDNSPTSLLPPPRNERATAVDAADAIPLAHSLTHPLARLHQ